MPIDVEKLALEAGFKERNGQIRVQHSNGSFVVVDEELSRFAALVLEAAAVQCEDESWEGRRHADAIRAMLSASPQAPQAACWCEACDLAQGHPMGRTRMSVCPQCGDKRCPRAKRHDSACSAPQAAQPVQPKAFYTYIDITLTEEESALLKDTLGWGGQTSPVRLQIGNGHGGYGLYASSAEYPEEGAVRICDVAQPTGAVLKPLSDAEWNVVFRAASEAFFAPGCTSLTDQVQACAHASMRETERAHNTADEPRRKASDSI